MEGAVVEVFEVLAVGVSVDVAGKKERREDSLSRETRALGSRKTLLSSLSPYSAWSLARKMVLVIRA